MLVLGGCVYLEKKLSQSEVRGIGIIFEVL